MLNIVKYIISTEDNSITQQYELCHSQQTPKDGLVNNSKQMFVSDREEKNVNSNRMLLDFAKQISWYKLYVIFFECQTTNKIEVIY